MFDIKVDLNALAEVRNSLNINFDVLAEGLGDAADFVQQTWLSAVTGTKLPGMNKAINDDKYAKSLTTGKSLQFPQPFYAVVMPYGYAQEAEKIENGTPAFDLKPFLLNGPKSKESKDGGRYNTVPFRHFTPASNSSGSSPLSNRMRMPRDIYNQAKKLQRSAPNQQTGKIDWGQSLSVDEERYPAQTSWTGYTHKSSIYEGMYKVGEQKQTQYLTFRRVSSKSDPKSCWIPEVPPNPVVESVYNYCMPLVEDHIAKVAELAIGE